MAQENEVFSDGYLEKLSNKYDVCLDTVIGLARAYSDGLIFSTKITLEMLVKAYSTAKDVKLGI